MVQYTALKYKNGILQQNITNISLMEAYQIIKPPVMNPHNNRWHLMMYDAVVERISKLEDDQPLLVAWEEEMQGMDTCMNYIYRMSPFNSFL
jgi:hypothetical protein